MTTFNSETQKPVKLVCGRNLRVWRSNLEQAWNAILVAREWFWLAHRRPECLSEHTHTVKAALISPYREMGI